LPIAFSIWKMGDYKRKQMQPRWCIDSAICPTF
jgi:hypothetical protein